MYCILKALQIIKNCFGAYAKAFSINLQCDICQVNKAYYM